MTSPKWLYLVRGLSALAAMQIMVGFISPAAWILSAEQSIVGKVALLSSSATALSVSWLVCAFFTCPFVLMQLFNPHIKQRRAIIKISNLAMIGGCLIWVYMAFLSRSLDYEFVIWNFLFNAVAALAMAAIMANTLNNDQKAWSENNET